jgi:hypothetical protein
MPRTRVLGLLGALAVLTVLTSDARAQRKPVKLVKEWQGSVADEALAKDAPAFVADTKALEKLWTAWKIEGKPPTVDFKKELVLISTTRGSRLQLSPSIDEKGNVTVLALGTRDLAPGFRYVIATVSREGVKAVNGQELLDK